MIISPRLTIALHVLKVSPDIRAYSFSETYGEVTLNSYVTLLIIFSVKGF